MLKPPGALQHLPVSLPVSSGMRISFFFLHLLAIASWTITCIHMKMGLLTKSRNKAFICLSSTTTLAETAAAESGPLLVAITISVSNSYRKITK
jgi:Na+-transporting methylmalonyl-CoA/oxaloacetate decarboxylase gamma subunit